MQFLLKAGQPCFEQLQGNLAMTVVSFVQRTHGDFIALVHPEYLEWGHLK